MLRRLPLLRLRSQVDGAAAARGAARAFHLGHLGLEAVVDGKFLAGLDVARGHVKDVAAEDPGMAIRIATMVQILGATAAHASVERPIAVESEHVVQLAAGAFRGFAAVAALPGVLDDLPPLGNELLRIDAPAMNLGGADGEPEAGVFRGDRWRRRVAD